MASTLVSEDGTGKADADSYVTLTEANAYFAKHGSPAAWTSLSESQRDAALRYGTAALDGMVAWTGEIQVSTQALGWPRYDATDNEERLIASGSVPDRVKAAVCELALLHASTALNTAYDRGGAIVREKAGPVEVEYAPGAAPEPALPILRRLLNGIGALRGHSVTLERS
jgi:hypothetical protein